jgi:hypothetical protein
MGAFSYFDNGLQHAIIGACFGWFFYRASHINYFKKWEYLLALLMSSSAFFFVPGHIGRYGSLLDRVYQFLHYPLADWDILLFGMDWHRFFITHSLILPAIVLIVFLHKPIGYWVGLGLCVGQSSHLMWDALTCSLRTAVVFINNIFEIRGYWGKGWLLLNGLVLLGLAWFVVRNMPMPLGNRSSASSSNNDHV